MKRIQSKRHKLGTYEIDKVSMSCSDRKRYFLDDRIRTLAYFYKSSVTIKQIVMIEKDCDD